MITRPTITSAYNELWKRVWSYGRTYKDERGDLVKSLDYVWIEIKSDNIDYPKECPVSKAIADRFTDSLVDWECIKDTGEQFDYGYGERLYREDALSTALFILENNKESRRCAIPITTHSDLKHSFLYGKEIPCATQIELGIVDDQLDIVVHMRSNDVLNAFPSDAYGYRTLQKQLSDRLDVPIGNYYHYIRNAHIIGHTAEDWITRHKQ